MNHTNHFKNKTIVVSAASLILSGIASAEVLKEGQVGEVPGTGNRTPTIDSDNMTVPEPYLPETEESPFSWNYNLPDEASSFDNTSFLALNDESSKMSIRAAQQTLTELGYDVEVDGIAGRETKSALRDFQAANGIAQTAKLDTPTVAALRDAASMDPDRYPASFEDEELPYDSAFPPFPEDMTIPGVDTNRPKTGTPEKPK